MKAEKRISSEWGEEDLQECEEEELLECWEEVLLECGEEDFWNVEKKICCDVVC